MTADYEPFVNSSPKASQGVLGLALLLGCCTGCGDSRQGETSGTTGEAPACVEPTFLDGLPDTWRPCGCGMGPWFDACPEETHACMYQFNEGTTGGMGDVIGGTCLQRCLRNEDCEPVPGYPVECGQYGVCAIPCDNGCPDGMTCSGENFFLENRCLHNFSPG